MLKAGIIGCGGIGRRHARGYLDSGRYELVAIADPRAEALAEMDENFSAHASYTGRHYSDAAEMLDAEGLDVVSVSVWHRGHAPWTIEAAKRGVAGIICEKPMAGSLAEARKMVDVCGEQGTKLVIGHQRRFLPTYNLARQMIAEGAIGEVQLARCYSNDGLLNWASHFMDMFRYILDDDCEWVMGSVERTTDRYERDLRVEDRAVCTVGFKGGAIGLVLSGLDSHYYQGGIFYGTDGTIDLTPERLRLLNGGSGGWAEHVPDGVFSKQGPEWNEYKEGCTAQAVELADWIEGKTDTHRGEATHGYKALEMCMAVYESALHHRRVELPLAPSEHPLDELVESGHLPVMEPGKYDIRERPFMRGP